MNETINLMKNHKSIRKYIDKPIDEHIFNEIIACAQSAPTSSFMQAYSIIRITDSTKRQKLTELSGQQSYIQECPEFLVFCADLHKLELSCNLNNVEMATGYTESFIIATVDAALAAQNALTAAESLGLGGVYIGGIRNNPEEISKLLELPKNVYAVFGMCLGYPAENPEIKIRMPKEVALSIDSYKVDENINYIKSYDEKIKQYYIARTGGVRKDTWTAQMAMLNSKPLRPHMKNFLYNTGFEMK